MGEQGRDPTLEELAKELQLAKEEVVLAMESSAQIESLQKTIYQSDGSDIALEIQFP